MRDKQIINSCEFQSRCIQYKDMYSNKHIICPIVDFALACRGENKCKYKTVYEQLKAKEQECEKLEEENQKLEMQLCNECGEKDDYNIPCKMIRDLDYGLQMELEENDRYHKALEEIEEYINNQGINHKWNMYIQRFRQKILYIINEAKGEE